ncbi:MAG: translocation/assembly module TamB domain-containing protein [Burkholderiales bacterium]
MAAALFGGVYVLMARRVLRIVVVLGLLLLAVFAGAGAWLLGTQQGLAWALSRVAEASGGKLLVDRPRGTLGGGLEIKRVRYVDGDVRVDVREVRLRMSPLSVVLLQPEFAFLECRELEIALPEASGAVGMPESLALPTSLHLDRVRVGTLRVRSGAAVHVLRDVRFAYGYSRGRHRVQDVHAELEGVTLEGRGTLHAAKPFAVASTLSISGNRSGVPYGAELELSGDLEKLGLRGRVAVKSAAGELRATLRPLTELWPETVDIQARELDLHALDPALPRTQLRASLSLTRRGKAYEGRLSAENALAGRPGAGRLPLASLDATVSTDLSSIELSDLGVRLGTAGSIAGRLTLDAAMQFDAALELSHIDLSQLGALPPSELAGKVSLSGSLAGERRVRAEFSLAPSQLAGQALAGNGRALVEGKRIAESALELHFSGASVGAEGSFGRPSDRLRLRVEADDLSTLATGVAGGATLRGEISGGWDHPAAALEVNATHLSARGIRADRVRITVEGTKSHHDVSVSAQGGTFDFAARIEGMLQGWSAWRGTLLSATNRGTVPFELERPAPISVAPRRVEIGAVAVRFAQGRATLTDLRWEEGRLASSGTLQNVGVVPLLRLAGKATPLEGNLTLGAEWSMTTAPQLEGRFRLWREAGDLAIGGSTQLELGLSSIDVSGRVVDGELEATGSLAATHAKGDLQLSLRPVAGGQGWPYSADSTLDARLGLQLASLAPFAMLIDRSARIDGTLSTTLVASGTLARPVIGGTVDGDGIRYARPPDGIDLVDGRLRSRLEGNILHVSQLTIAGAAGGSFSAEGTLTPADATRAALTWRAEKLALLNRPDQRLVLSGQGAAAMAHGRLSFSGALQADHGFFSFEANALPQLGEDVVVAGREAPGAAERRIGRRENPSPVDVDFELDLGRDLRIRGRGLDTGLAGKVHVRTDPAGVLTGKGVVHTVGGTVTAYGTRLSIERGRLIFDGPMNRPSLDILAMRRNQEVQAGVAVTGTVQNPTVRIVSEPPVPEGEALSWLVLGRAPGTGSGADIAMLQSAAGALLGRSALGTGSSLARTVGLDSVSVGDRGQAGGQFVTLGKRVNDRMTVFYEQSLGATASVLRLDFELSRLWSLSASTGQRSDLGVRFRYSFD